MAQVKTSLLVAQTPVNVVSIYFNFTGKSCLMLEVLQCTCFQFGGDEDNILFLSLFSPLRAHLSRFGQVRCGFSERRPERFPARPAHPNYSSDRL